MDVIERLNRRFGAWYEGLFGASSDRDLRPRDILRRLLAAMEDARREGLDGQVYVPNVYTLQIAVADDDERDYLRTFLSAEDLAAAVRRAIEQHNYRVRGSLVFQIEEVAAGQLPAGQRVLIRSRFDGSSPAIPAETVSGTAPVRRSRPPSLADDESEEDEEDELGTVVGAPSQVLASLVVRDGEGRLREVYPLGARGAQIGRSRKAGNDIILNGDAMISKRHATILYQPAEQRFAVRDNGSTNGTVVNGVQLASGAFQFLSPGDQILLGETVMTFRPTEQKGPSGGGASARSAVTTLLATPLPMMLVADNGAIYPIASEMTVGRAVTSDLVLDNDGVATKHARLFRTAPASGGGDERIYVEDFDSSAGTFVNGERIPARFPVALYENDVLAFGATTLRVLRRSDPGA